MVVINVALGGRSYEVQVGAPGVLREAAHNLGGFLPSDTERAVPVVADSNAMQLHGGRLTASLEAEGRAIAWYEISSGEASKSWGELERLTDWLLAQGVTRSDHVLALGGGVVGDLTGLACALVKRGAGFVQIPTTLLAQVDSSVGGKTAINTSAGKNLIGAFHQPSAVLIDPATLDTLPDREMRAGLAEVFKYGLLGDAEFFGWLESHASVVLARETDALTHAIATSIRMKARIVAEDERETSGVRALLNLGHTFGHALEAETGFSDKLLHGEAVALGMVLAARYSARRSELSDADAERVAIALSSVGLPTEIAALGMDTSGTKLVEHIRHDKKATGGTVPFLLLRALGEAYLARDVDLADVAAFLDQHLIAH